MAPPKRRQSKQRTALRFANYKAATPQVGGCPQCHEPKLGHRVCKHCGYYDGVKRVDFETKAKE